MKTVKSDSWLGFAYFPIKNILKSCSRKKIHFQFEFSKSAKFETKHAPKNVDKCGNLLLPDTAILTKPNSRYSITRCWLDRIELPTTESQFWLVLQALARSADVERSEKSFKIKIEAPEKAKIECKGSPNVDGKSRRRIWVNVNRFDGSIELGVKPRFEYLIQFINDWKFFMFYGKSEGISILRSMFAPILQDFHWRRLIALEARACDTSRHQDVTHNEIIVSYASTATSLCRWKIFLWRTSSACRN